MGLKWWTPFVIQAELHVVKLPNCLLEGSLPLTLHLIMSLFSSRHGLMVSNCVWSGTTLRIFWCLYSLILFLSGLKAKRDLLSSRLWTANLQQNPLLLCAQAFGEGVVLFFRLTLTSLLSVCAEKQPKLPTSLHAETLTTFTEPKAT